MKKFEYQILEWHGPDEWRECNAHDAEHAAEIAGEYYDCDGDYLLSRDENNNVRVLVKDITGHITHWTVYASHHVSYGAHQD